MAGKDQDYRIFVGGLAWDVTDRQLQDSFRRFGKIIDCQVMLERDTGRPRGFGFITFADRRGMEDAIREMHGRELGDRAISVNRAQPKMGSDDPDHGYGYSSGGRGSNGGDRSAGPDDCFKCGRPGHWARDCPSGGGGRAARPFTPPRSRFGGAGGRGDRYGGDRDRYVEDRYPRGRYEDKDPYNGKEDRYGSRGVSDRYPPVPDRFAGVDRYDRYGGPDRFPPNSYGKDRSYDRDGGQRSISDRYAGGGPVRFEPRSYRERPAPYERPRRGGHAPSFDRYGVVFCYLVVSSSLLWSYFQKLFVQLEGSLYFW